MGFSGPPGLIGSTKEGPTTQHDLELPETGGEAFPTHPSGLPEATGPALLELGNGDVLKLLAAADTRSVSKLPRPLAAAITAVSRVSAHYLSPLAFVTAPLFPVPEPDRCRRAIAHAARRHRPKSAGRLLATRITRHRGDGKRQIPIQFRQGLSELVRLCRVRALEELIRGGDGMPRSGSGRVPRDHRKIPANP